MQCILPEDNLVAAVLYLDDVTVVGQDFITCWQNMSHVVSWLTNVGMNLSPKKCFFLYLDSTVLDHCLGTGTLRPHIK